MNPEIKWCSNDDYHIMTCKFLRSEMNFKSLEWSTIHNLEGTKRIGIRLARLYELMEEHDFLFTGKTTITIDPPQAEIIANTSIVLERFKLEVTPVITWSISSACSADYSTLIVMFPNSTPRLCSIIKNNMESIKMIGTKLVKLYGVLLSNNLASRNARIFTEFHLIPKNDDMPDRELNLTAVNLNIIL